MVASTDLVNDILVAVSQLPNTFAWRSNSGNAILPKTGQWVKINVPGIGDISGCHNGRAFSIEVKYGTGRPSINQKRFRDAWMEAGGFYLVARSIDEALAAIKALS